MITQIDKEEGRVSVADSSVLTYRPKMSALNLDAPEKTVFGVIPSKVFTSRKAFIDVSRKGIPGRWVKSVIDATGLRETFLEILNVSSGNLSREYRKKALTKEASEEVLDAVRLLSQAVDVWESRPLAIEWLNSPVVALGGERPITLFDTFEGRRWVSQVLNKIEHGEFS
jgi:putative toxin-antitoxin system antitoxin component (TIGR02293 family)